MSDCGVRMVQWIAILLLLWHGVPLTRAEADTSIGDIAVIEADATVLQPGELFDLNDRSLTFTPMAGGGYMVSNGPPNFESTVGSNLSMGNDSSQSRTLSFSFPFFGVNYNNVFTNSNGHLTFNASRATDFHFNDICGGNVSKFFDPNACPDAATVLVLMAEDLPRIAPLWQGYMIRDKQDHVVWGTNTWHTRQIQENVKCGEVVVFRLPFNCTLEPGSYSVSPALVSSETRLINDEWIDNLLVFDVINVERDIFIGTNWLDAQFFISRQGDERTQ